jgi:Cof subfamily protein (haloacid dehalogenase superfamily)
MMAFDLDGTLLHPTGTITARTIAALHAAHDAGIRIALATGRPPFMLGDVVERVGTAITHGVMANGALVCTFPDGQVLYQETFAIDRAVHTIGMLRLIDADIGFALATDTGFAAEAGFAERMPATGKTPVVPDVLVAATGATVAAKLMAFHPQVATYDLIEFLAQHLDADLQPTHMGAEAVEIGPAGIDKASGLRWLCQHLGIQAGEVITFGDNANDNTMLAWSGRSVAMGNAAERTQVLATDITLSNEQDGVAVFVERLLGTR